MVTSLRTAEGVADVRGPCSHHVDGRRVVHRTRVSYWWSGVGAGNDGTTRELDGPGTRVVYGRVQPHRDRTDQTSREGETDEE
jgi:hypothetical protein